MLSLCLIFSLSMLFLDKFKEGHILASLDKQRDCPRDITNLCVTEQHENVFFVKTLFLNIFPRGRSIALLKI